MSRGMLPSATVFPHNGYVPYKDNGDGTVIGSGINDTQQIELAAKLMMAVGE